MYCVLYVCPIVQAREATLRHLASLMRTDPIIHGCRQWQVVARPGYMAAQELLQQVKDSRLPSTSAVQGIPLDGSPTKVSSYRKDLTVYEG